MNIQWYPGHMTKAKRDMQEDIKLIDLIIELVDARIPLSSRNPDIDDLGKNKSRLLLLNKADLADEKRNKQWEDWFLQKGLYAVRVNSRSRSDMKTVDAAIMKACQKKIARDRRRGIQNRPVRALVAGIPNVGKSTFINTLAGKACAKTGNRPGVTRGKQWICLKKNVELLDTPGLLWPKFDDQEVGIRLAMVGSIKDELLNVDELALLLLQYLKEQYPGSLQRRYDFSEDQKPLQMLEEIAVRRSCLLKGGELDYSKAASYLLDDFRSGKLGRITLETPPQAEETE